MTITVKFGAAIKAARIRKGITQMKLAEMLDMEQGHLSRIESGNYHGSITNAMATKIAEKLGCDIHVLLK